MNKHIEPSAVQRSPIERSISYVLIGLIMLFAITSTGNVTEYIHRYHHGWTGVTLGLCYGMTVFTCAYIAATARQFTTRICAIVIGSVFGVASATFQTNIYVDGGADGFVAAALSYIPIIAGEVGLAILEHFYSAEASKQGEHNPLQSEQSSPMRSAVQNIRVVPAKAVQSEQKATELTVQPIVQPTVQPDVQPELKQIEQRSEAIAPRTEQESRFWQMLSEGVQYKITVLAREWNVAPNTLRDWRKRWNSVQPVQQEFSAAAD